MSGYTKGPWRWFGNTQHHSLYLATVNRGRIFVMGFNRWGMRNAQPTFQSESHIMVPASDLVEYERDYRKDVNGINHPDAKLIETSPEIAEALLDMVDNGEGCVTGNPDCEPECCRYGRAREVLRKAQVLPPRAPPRSAAAPTNGDGK